MIAIEDSASKKRAFVGLGFEFRNDAFDFNLSLQKQYKCFISHHRQSQSLKEIATSQTPLELSLKEGEKISINIPFLAQKTPLSMNVDSEPPKTVQFIKPPSKSSMNKEKEEDWSGFQSFSTPSNWAKFD